MSAQLQPGTMTTNQRRVQLEETRFLDIRNLAYLTYKKPDGSPLLTYEETLNNRDVVKLTILQYEIAQGWLIPDGTEQQTQVAVVPPAVQNSGAPQMTSPFPPPQPGIPQQQFAPPGVQAPPQMIQQPPAAFAPQPQAAPQQQTMPFPQPGVPQQFAPQPQQQMAPPPQAAAPQAAPPQAEQPAAAPSGRGRRKAAAPAGTAVAPPPAAPPPAAQPQVQQQQVPVQQFAPAPQGAPPMFAQQAAPAPQFAPQGAAPQFQQAAPAPVAGAPAPTASVDLSPVIGRLDNVGQLVSSLTGEVAALKQIVAAQQETITLMFTAVAHGYFTNPSLAPGLAQAQVQQTPAALREYLKKFTP